MTLTILSFCTLKAQQDPLYSQYMFSQMAINPAYAGINDFIELGMDVRDQWTGIPGRPKTNTFEGNAPFKLFGIQSGVGLAILTDNLGWDNNLAGRVSYSYKMNIRNGKLGIGFSAGFNNHKFTPKDILPPSGQGTEGNDQNIPAGGDKATGFDLGLGTYYKSDNLYLGFSVNHLIASTLKFEKGAYKPVMNYNLLAGYHLQLANPAFEVQPSTFVSSDGRISQITLNTNLTYNKKVWGGIGYRIGDSFIPSFGLELFGGVQTGFSYDFTTSSLSKNTLGGWELTLRYNFTMKVDKTPQRYKSVRFL